jgi:DNA-binding Lrp family transcriptional regulator
MSAPKPAATIAVSTAYPATSPATAGTSVASRNPTAITYAQSGPGVNTSSTSTATNVASALALIVMSKLRPTVRKMVANPLHAGLRWRKILRVDRVDRKILAELEQNGRLTITELAARINLSVSPCHRRLRELERSGAIRGYRAIVDAATVGLGFQALVFASLHQGDRDTVASFEEAVTDVPQVIQAQRLFGDPDYLLRVVAADLPSFQRLYDERLATLPGLRRLTSTIVMKDLVDHRPLTG